MTVETGALVNVANTLKIWGAGTLNLDGGTISAGAVETAGTTFNWTSGIFQITGGLAYRLGTLRYSPCSRSSEMDKCSMSSIR